VGVGGCTGSDCGVMSGQKGCVLGERLATCAHEWILYSHKGMSLLNIRLTRVYGCVGVGHWSSSMVIGIEVDRVEKYFIS
jgi:hypothetical protein